MLAELAGSGVRWRGRLLGPGGAVAELRTPWPCVVYDVFWLLSFGLYVPAPTRLAPSGGLRAENSSARDLASLRSRKIFRLLPDG